MRVGARLGLSNEAVGRGEPKSERGEVELAVAVAGSIGGRGPTVVTSQREFRPAGRRIQRESTSWRQKRERKQNENSEGKAKKRGGDRTAGSTSKAVDWGPGDSGDAAKHAAKAAATFNLHRTADRRVEDSGDAAEPAAKPANSWCPTPRPPSRGLATAATRPSPLPRPPPAARPPPRLPPRGRASAGTPPSLVTKPPPPRRPSPSATTQGQAKAAAALSPVTRLVHVYRRRLRAGRRRRRGRASSHGRYQLLPFTHDCRLGGGR